MTCSNCGNEAEHFADAKVCFDCINITRALTRGRAEERAAIVAWLVWAGQNRNYHKYGNPLAMVAGHIELGEHLPPVANPAPSAVVTCAGCGKRECMEIHKPAPSADPEGDAMLSDLCARVNAGELFHAPKPAPSAVRIPTVAESEEAAKEGRALSAELHERLRAKPAPSLETSEVEWLRKFAYDAEAWARDSMAKFHEESDRAERLEATVGRLRLAVRQVVGAWNLHYPRVGPLDEAVAALAHAMVDEPDSTRMIESPNGEREG